MWFEFIGDILIFGCLWILLVVLVAGATLVGLGPTWATMLGGTGRLVRQLNTRTWFTLLDKPGSGTRPPGGRCYVADCSLILPDVVVQFLQENG